MARIDNFEKGINKMGNRLLSFIRIILGIAILYPIFTCVFIVIASVVNVKTERCNVKIEANIGGGLYLGAKERELSKYYTFGESDKSMDFVHYYTSDYTTLFNKKFDKATVILESAHFTGKHNQFADGDGVVRTILLEKQGQTQEMRQFCKDLVFDLRKELGVDIPMTKQFFRKYTLISRYGLVEVKYEGIFKHYITLRITDKNYSSL